MRQLSVDYYQYIEDILRPEDVHDVHTSDAASANTGMFFVVALVLAALHGFNAYLALTGTAFAVVMIIHLVLVGFATMLAFAQYRKGHDVPFLALLAITTAATGVFGAAGSLFTSILYILLRQKALHFKEWFELIFPSDLTTDSERIYNNIMVGTDENPRQYGVMPFLEVMEIGSEEQKRRALSKMTVNFHPRLAPAFRRALNDQSNVIRVQAATAAAKIENQFMSKLQRIEEAREKEPSNKHIIFALAKFYDDYAYTGILDTEREMLNRQKAIDTYKSYLQHDPNSTEAWSSIGRLLFRSEQWEEAAEWFKHALDRGWRSKNMVLWYLESLFRTGNYRELRRMAVEYGRGITDNEELPNEIRECVGLWARR